MAEKDNSLRILLTGFKGKNNSSNILVQSISENYRLLTNSFEGLKKDIEEIDEDFDFLIMLGCDKNLKDSVRIERFAGKNGEKIASALDLENISKNLAAAEINNFISDSPGHFFCNDAYWYALQKFNSRAVFIHIPTIKNIDDSFIDKMKKFVSQEKQYMINKEKPLNLSEMTEDQFDLEMEKDYQSIQRGEGIPIEEAFEKIKKQK